MPRPKISLLLTLDGAEPTIATGGPGRIAAMVLNEFLHHPTEGIETSLAKRGGVLSGASLLHYINSYLDVSKQQGWPSTERRDMFDAMFLATVARAAAQTFLRTGRWNAGKMAGRFAAKRHQGLSTCREWLRGSDGASVKVVHSHTTWGILGAGDLRPECQTIGSPILITTFHTKGSIVQDIGGMLHDCSKVRYLLWEQEKKAIAASDIITFPSESAAALMAKEQPSVKDADVRIVYNGVAAESISANAALARTGSSQKPFTIVNVAAHDRQKNIPDILVTLRELLKERPCQLIQIGTGALTEELHSKAVDLGVSEHVQWMGKLSNIEVIRTVATSDVYLVASDNVIFDLATLEAMAAGVPVVVTRDGGNIECITDGIEGYLVEVGSTRSMVNAIRSIWSNPLRAQQMAIVASQRVKMQFSTGVMARKYASMYEELCVAVDKRCCVES